MSYVTRYESSAEIGPYTVSDICFMFSVAHIPVYFLLDKFKLVFPYMSNIVVLCLRIKYLVLNTVWKHVFSEVMTQYKSACKLYVIKCVPQFLFLFFSLSQIWPTFYFFVFFFSIIWAVFNNFYHDDSTLRYNAMTECLNMPYYPVFCKQRIWPKWSKTPQYYYSSLNIIENQWYN